MGAGWKISGLFSGIMEKQTSLGQWTGFVWVLVFSPAEWPPAWQASCHLHALHCEEALQVHIFQPHTLPDMCPQPCSQTLTSLVALGPGSNCLSHTHCCLPRLELPRCSGHLLKSLTVNPRPSALLLLTSVKSYDCQFSLPFTYQAKRPTCLCIQGLSSGCWQFSVFVQER